MDPSNYELLRNRTLLFFIEKLIDTQQQTEPSSKKRTLHDLSCQFGSKGFTKEMRQIAGGSQSGLKKFLSEYPSIFAIDGDLVAYHDTSAATATSTAQQPTATSTPTPHHHQQVTYGTDAANYFRDRLLQYGIGVWVPIKSLLGHRSQAPSEVRHVSGQHLSEFRSFLARFPDTFKIDDANNTVILTEFANEATNTSVATATDPDSSSTAIIDLRSSLKLVEFFGGVLTNRGGPMMLDQLFHVAAAANMFNDVIIKTPNDLKSFFHIHNQCFQVTSSMVTLQQSYSVGLLHLTQSANKQQQLLQQQNNNNNSAATALSSTPTEHVALKAITKPKPSLLTDDDSDDVTPQSPAAAAAPTLKTRVSKILLKTLTDNVERDNYNSSSSSSSANHRASLNSSPPLETLLKADPFDEEALKSALFSRTVVVSNTRKGKSIIEDLISGSSPSNPVLLAVDCEGVNLGDPHAGKITQIQVTTATTTSQQCQIVYIFDILTQPGLLPDIKTLLQHQHVTKIMHDCRNDSVNLYREHGIRLRNVFDTQAAHVVIQSYSNGSGGDGNGDGNSSDTATATAAENSKKVKNISLNNLCSLYCSNTIFNPFKEKIKTTYRHDVRYWSRRPLTRQMISYACCDVLCLPPIHKEMTKRLNSHVNDSSCRSGCAGSSSSAAGEAAISLLEELTEDQILAHIHPDEIRLRRRIRKNEQDLRELKSKIDAALNNNTDIVLSNREMRLLKHLELSDVAKEKLKSSLKVAKKLEKMENKNNPQILSSQQQQQIDSPSDNDSSLTSLEHIDNIDPLLITTKNLNTIDNLQAIIDNIFQLDNNNSSSSVSTATTTATNNDRVEASTQTHSTGDIVVMNVYKE